MIDAFGAWVQSRSVAYTLTQGTNYYVGYVPDITGCLLNHNNVITVLLETTPPNCDPDYIRHNHGMSTYQLRWIGRSYMVTLSTARLVYRYVTNVHGAEWDATDYDVDNTGNPLYYYHVGCTNMAYPVYVGQRDSKGNFIFISTINFHWQRLDKNLNS